MSESELKLDKIEEMPDAEGREPEPLLLSARQVARLLSLSERAVWRFAGSGRIPAPFRVGGRRLWDRRRLLAWIKEGCPVGRQ